jgi:hypothetical protein
MAEALQARAPCGSGLGEPAEASTRPPAAPEPQPESEPVAEPPTDLLLSRSAGELAAPSAAGEGAAGQPVLPVRRQDTRRPNNGRDDPPPEAIQRPQR